MALTLSQSFEMQKMKDSLIGKAEPEVIELFGQLLEQNYLLKDLYMKEVERNLKLPLS